MAGNYIEPQVPIMQNGDFYYPLTTAKQTILPDGRRLGGEDGLNITADDVNALSVDLTDVEQGVAAGINADTLDGKVASEYMTQSEFDVHKNELESNINMQIGNLENTIISQINDVSANLNDVRSEIPTKADDIGAAVVNFYVLSFPSSDWVEQNDGSYTQQVAVNGLLETNYANVDVDMSSATVDTYSNIQDAWSMVNRAQSVNEGLLLTCFDGAPEIDLTVKLEVIR